MSFFSVASLEDYAEGAVVLVSEGKVTASLAAGGNIAEFVSANAYPLVGQLTPEN